MTVRVFDAIMCIFGAKRALSTYSNFLVVLLSLSMRDDSFLTLLHLVFEL